MHLIQVRTIKIGRGECLESARHLPNQLSVDIFVIAETELTGQFVTRGNCALQRIVPCCPPSTKSRRKISRAVFLHRCALRHWFENPFPNQILRYSDIDNQHVLFRAVGPLTIRAGIPTAVAPSGTSIKTTDMAPILQLLPIFTPPITCA